MPPQSALVHWVNSTGACCGAADGAYLSAYTHAVTCPACRERIRADLERRRLAMRNLALAVERIRRRLPDPAPSEAATPSGGHPGPDTAGAPSRRRG